jgi:hypothetical protein
LSSSHFSRTRILPSRTSFAGTPLSQPNAALWESIRPAPPASLPTRIRSKLAALSLSVSARRWIRRLPRHLASPRDVTRWILGPTLGLCLGLGFGVLMPGSALWVEPGHVASTPETDARLGSVQAGSAVPIAEAQLAEAPRFVPELASVAELEAQAIHSLQPSVAPNPADPAPRADRSPRGKKKLRAASAWRKSRARPR